MSKNFLSNNIEFYRIDKTLPEINTKNCSGMELYAREETIVYPCFRLIEKDLGSPILLNPGQPKRKMLYPAVTILPTLIPLNVILRGNCLIQYLLFPRSSLYIKKGLLMTNGVGVIEDTYEGIEDELKMPVLNLTPEPIIVNKGERLAQLVVLYKGYLKYKEVQEHWGSKTRGGFGSTGYESDKEVIKDGQNSKDGK